MDDAERNHVAGTQLLLAEIEACRGDPEVTPEIRFLATCAMVRPEALRHADLHRLAAAMMRFVEKRRSASSTAEWASETRHVGGPRRLI